jgi:hypothetical protein
MTFDSTKLGRFYCTTAIDFSDPSPTNVAAIKIGSSVNFVGGFKRQNNSTATTSIASSTAMNTTLSYTIVDVASGAVELATAMAALAVTLLSM